MNLLQRAKAPTPAFFKIIRTAGLVLAAVGGTLPAAPFAVPATLITPGGYLTVAGGVIPAVSQVTVDENAQDHDNP